MRAWLLCVALLLAPARTLAQTYTAPTEPPRTLDLKAVSALVAAREVHERFRLGLDAEARGDWNAAQAHFRRIIALDPAEPRGSTARYDLALAEAHLGDDAGAMTLLDAALQRDPGFAAAAANLVTVALHAGDVARASAAAKKLLQIAPASALGRYGAGLAALQAGDYEAARAAFRALLAADPSYAVAYYDLGLAEMQRGALDDAVAALQHAVALSPHYARARFALGGALLRLGRRDDARAQLTRCAVEASDPTLRALASDLLAQLP